MQKKTPAEQLHALVMKRIHQDVIARLIHQRTLDPKFREALKECK